MSRVPRFRDRYKNSGTIGSSSKQQIMSQVLTVTPKPCCTTLKNKNTKMNDPEDKIKDERKFKKMCQILLYIVVVKNHCVLKLFNLFKRQSIVNYFVSFKKNDLIDVTLNFLFLKGFLFWRSWLWFGCTSLHRTVLVTFENIVERFSAFILA